MFSLICAALVAAPVLPGVTFHSRPGKVYVPAREAAKLMGWELKHDSLLGLTEIDGRPVPLDQPKLFNGSLLLEVGEVPNKTFEVRVGKPNVVVDLTKQTISVWQEPLMIMHTEISSGRRLKDTPPGNYKTGFRKEMHISSIYGSKMPYSVHLKGNYFIHGSELTQTGPGSNGCIRLPMHNDAAKWFFEWVEQDTPVKVHGRRPTPRTK